MHQPWCKPQSRGLSAEQHVEGGGSGCIIRMMMDVIKTTTVAGFFACNALAPFSYVLHISYSTSLLSHTDQHIHSFSPLLHSPPTPISSCCCLLLVGNTQECVRARRGCAPRNSDKLEAASRCLKIVNKRSSSLGIERIVCRQPTNSAGRRLSFHSISPFSASSYSLPPSLHLSSQPTWVLHVPTAHTCPACSCLHASNRIISSHMSACSRSGNQHFIIFARYGASYIQCVAFYSHGSAMPPQPDAARRIAHPTNASLCSPSKQMILY